MVKALRDALRAEKEAKAARAKAISERTATLVDLHAAGCPAPYIARHVAPVLGLGLFGPERTTVTNRIRKQLSRAGMTARHNSLLTPPGSWLGPAYPSSKQSNLEEQAMPQKNQILKRTTITTTEEFVQPQNATPEPDELDDHADGCDDADDDEAEPEEQKPPRRR